MSVLDMILNDLMIKLDDGALENVKYFLIAIAPKSKLARSWNTW